VIRRIPLSLRLAAAATLASALALAILTLAITLLVHRNLVGDIDNRLQAQVTEEQTEDPSSVEPALSGSAAGDFGEPVLEWNTSASGQPGVSDAAAASLALPAAVRSTIGLRDVRLSGTEFRVLTMAAPGGGTVSVASSLSTVDNAIERLRNAEILLEPALLVLVFGGALLVARRTLAPVERLRRTADVVDAENADERFRPVPPHDELGRLAKTFDSMLDRLALARRRQMQLTADASHELRTPLSVLKGEAALALRRPRSRQEYRGAIERMGVEIERMENVLENLLWLARVQQDDVERPAASVDLTAAAAQAVERFAAMATSQGLRLCADLPDAPVTVDAPDGWVDRMTAIFVDNACKYTPGGGSVTVRVTDDPATLVVEDTGPGIPVVERERLLRRFQRGDTSGVPGSGLGLAIADAMVRRCGAEWAIDDADQGGCRITVTWAGEAYSRSVHGLSATLAPDESSAVGPRA
jgi:signal transduction histidine kinase